MIKISIKIISKKEKKNAIPQTLNQEVGHDWVLVFFKTDKASLRFKVQILIRGVGT